MEQASILTYLAVVAMMVLTPGPNLAVILQSVAARGWRGGFGNLFGIAAAFYFHALCSVIGLTLVLRQAPALFTAVKALGAAYLIYLGAMNLRMAWRAAGRESAAAPTAAATHSTKGALFEGFMTNALNPKVGLFYLAIFPQYIDPNESVYAKSLLLVTIHASFAFGWYALLIVGFDRYRRRMGTSKSMVIAARLVIATVLIGLGLKVLIT
ncbi:LysE family translocator [Verminephrobacter aporrectodeae subsp. tuberculatae]|uniref:LysE family translocator n=1 Tax=Verminephrobacter aporrectodeae TaxID=1110389 RepID=UPI0022381856|nr:LysE family translocator [Verminephrobacter aporrectodeae]MCW5220924.1 LysE family translocator [Verminephrobacter aporrectodeae subsp. tuberculatae]MCW5290219.1 LysE family translocator [Verminephrobacter aporrectodeae subsp. tuberculatae]MCW8197902.1 LysE family translocator [Verminephrobacter aporrectodeae subsp. tuberculatae]MCW8206189.1 LysE family translocator [Verminephrobacter aporrectodeae subsp. tuberculatae]